MTMLDVIASTMIMFVLLLVNSYFVHAQEVSCCSLAAGSCRNVCSKISLVDLGATAIARENATNRLSQFCPLESVDFWNCINGTLKDAKKNENWIGRACCYLALNPICRSKCALSGPKSDLNEFCRPSEELEFHSCLERREEAERCCNNVSNETCRSVCRDLYDKPGKQLNLKLYTSKGCFHQVPKCLKRVIEVKYAEDPKKYLHCCEKASNPGCLEICRETLRTATTDAEIMNALSEKCSPVQPQLPIWRCFLESSPSKPQRLPLDAGKLTCCSKAVRGTCQDICRSAFQGDWESAWTQLDSECLSSSLEGELRRCLDDAEDTCEMGCTGLSYCAHFNNRPTTLFRSCSAAADETAKWEANHWSRGGLVRGLEVIVRASSSCPVETLRAAACLMKLRPCETRIHETRLCREDCLELMANCVDWSAITKPHTAGTLCAKISPGRSDAPCVSLKPFLNDPRDDDMILRPEEDITTPCKSNPCTRGQICTPQTDTIKGYRCLPACSLGEMSKQLVPVGTWVQIPRSDQQGCLKICQCTKRGLEKCRDLNCFTFNNCWVQDRFVAHRSNFYLECNACHCFENEVTCSRKGCDETRRTFLPCDCPTHYVPVCGRFGVTYASSCLAKCAGLSANEIEFGACSARDPCASNPCESNERCLRRSRVCLSPIHKPCRQYECVAMNCDVRGRDDEPVCDSDNRQHPSVCALLRTGASLGYRGPCLSGCSLRGPVCGINGEIYINECAAWAEKTVVDYFGPCVAVGAIGDHAEFRCGTAVQCPSLVDPYCIGVTPPGACCPVCGGAARLFYSKKQLDRIYYMMDEEGDKESVTLDGLLTALGRQIQVAQCSLRGMVTTEGDIFVLNQAVSKKPSSIQLRACVTEVEKLVTRILERSPRIASEVPLGSLTRAEVAHGHISGGINQQYWFAIIIFMIVLLKMIT